MSYPRFGNAHVDDAPQLVVKFRMEVDEKTVTLKFTKENAVEIATALETDLGVVVFDLKQREVEVTRTEIILSVSDSCSHTEPLRDDWGLHSWQRLLVMCRTFAG